ncbi:MAG: Na-K-Cl cotransporter [bacterium]
MPGITRQEREEPRRGHGFGTFAGVFTPAVLTILGVILFLRAGWVVGNAGLAGALAIIVISNLITLSTGLSLSTIATSMDIGGGGNYYLISRTLGLAAGGSIGIPLYLSQAISIAFYIIGFTEGLMWVFPNLSPVWVASATCIILSFISFIGADWAIRVQYVIMACLGFALVSFFWGGARGGLPLTWRTSGGTAGFWLVFAIYFPAVTGIEVGVGMSGDLENPSRSIPRGTLAAIGVTFLIYVLQAFWFVRNVSPGVLRSNTSIMMEIARWRFPILLGLWAATLSSALGNILAAPRTMQALAKDRILHRFMGKGSGPANEPRIALLVTFGIAEAVILLGKLDIVAPVVTMFFLNTYGVVNLIAALENIVGNPSFRPRLKVHWIISLLGALGCYCVMFLINAQATVIAIAVTAIIYFALKRRVLTTAWGDVRSGIWFSLIRFALLKLKGYEWHPRNWKPNLLVFSGNPNTRDHLVFLARSLEKGGGFLSLVQMILGPCEDQCRFRKMAINQLADFIDKENIQAFPVAYVADNLREGVLAVTQCHGIGKVYPNIVMMGWSAEPARTGEFGQLIRDLHLLGKSVILLKVDMKRGFGNRQLIDVWWGGQQQNRNLMILLAHLLSLNREWRDCEIRLNMGIRDITGREKAFENITRFLEEMRIKAAANIIPYDPDKVSIWEIITSHSADADLVILGMGMPEEGEEEGFINRMDSLLQRLPTTLLVKSLEEIMLVR